MEKIKKFFNSVPERYFILRILFYFLAGVGGFFWAIPLSIWLYFKTKQNKKIKFFSLVIGLLIYLLIPYGMKLFIHYQYPIIENIESSIDQKFPGGQSTISFGYSKVWKMGEDSVASSYFNLKYKTDQLISGERMLDIGKFVCSEDKIEGQKYDQIYIENIVYPLIIPIYNKKFNANAPCGKWLNDEKFSEMLKSTN